MWQFHRYHVVIGSFSRYARVCNLYSNGKMKLKIDSVATILQSLAMWPACVAFRDDYFPAKIKLSLPLVTICQSEPII